MDILPSPPYTARQYLKVFEKTLREPALEDLTPAEGTLPSALMPSDQSLPKPNFLMFFFQVLCAAFKEKPQMLSCVLNSELSQHVKEYKLKNQGDAWFYAFYASLLSSRNTTKHSIYHYVSDFVCGNIEFFRALKTPRLDSSPLCTLMLAFQRLAQIEKENTPADAPLLHNFSLEAVFRKCNIEEQQDFLTKSLEEGDCTSQSLGFAFNQLKDNSDLVLKSPKAYRTILLYGMGRYSSSCDHEKIWAVLSDKPQRNEIFAKLWDQIQKESQQIIIPVHNVFPNIENLCQAMPLEDQDDLIQALLKKNVPWEDFPATLISRRMKTCLEREIEDTIKENTPMPSFLKKM